MDQEAREVIVRLEDDMQERCTALEATVASLRINQHTQPAICAHLKVNHLCYVWGHRGKKVCACCEKARK